jgi:4-hydroxy-3-methylbut-2-enyl diphosphate reductase
MTSLPRTVLLASPRSCCAGVERAIEIVELALAQRGAAVYVRNQIVHNAHVVSELETRGAVFVDELDEVPDGAMVVFSAHGVSPAVRVDAARRGLSVIDATCPLVTSVHAEARRAAARGGTIVLIGHAGHEEVDETTAVIAALTDRFPDAAGPGAGDICYATTNRQNAVAAIAAEADLVLIVGSPNSHNSARLGELSRRCGVPARLIEDAAAIQPHWLDGVATVGVSAGASAPEHLVEGVIAYLRSLGPIEVVERLLTVETIQFGLPKQVRPSHHAADTPHREGGRIP